MTKSEKTHTPSTTSAQRGREHEERSKKKKQCPLFDRWCARRRSEHEARSAETNTRREARKKNSSFWRMTCVTKRQARGAKREKIFPHSDRWRTQRGRGHEARSAENFFSSFGQMTSATEARARSAKRENFFFLIRTDDEHNGCAGTRREARKKILPHSDRWRAQRRRGHEARSAKNFFATLLSLETLEGAGTAPRKETRKKKKEKREKKKKKKFATQP